MDDLPKAEDEAVLHCLMSKRLYLKEPVVDVIIPAYNEEKSIGLVLAEIPRERVREIIVANNASTDATAAVARRAGATVVDEQRKGYGSACLAAMAYIQAKPQPEQPHIVVFLDGDYSDYPEQMIDLLAPITIEDYDMVIGSRALGNKERGAMQPQQIFGNWLATHLIRFFYRYDFTDLGPFRAVKWHKLLSLHMQDPNFGWTVEMQVKAAKYGLKCTEVPVRYRKRVGQSKVSGTIKGSVLAGYKILWTIFKLL